MPIDWFPGHMAKARREVGEAMGRVDVVIEVLDARAPGASRSPLVEELRHTKNKPALKILNKADVADAALTTRWMDFYNRQPGTKAVALSARKGAEVSKLVKAAGSLAPGRGTPLDPLRLMILGIPNVGKSTLMNALLHKDVANVGDEPAITKTLTRHTIKTGVTIIDTPGMLWPGVDQDVAVTLAITHSIGRNAYDELTVALALASLLLRDWRSVVATRYKKPVPDDCEPLGLLEHIATARSIIQHDRIDKAAAVLLNDFRSGKLGRITLESPPST
jgi:ribosome biogenesis GTPase A